MFEFFKWLGENVIQGGHGALITILIGIIAAMAFLIWLLWKELQKKEEKIEKIQEKLQQDLQKVIEDYHKGNLTMVEAFNGLKMVLVEIRAKL